MTTEQLEELKPTPPAKLDAGSFNTEEYNRWNEQIKRRFVSPAEEKR